MIFSGATVISAGWGWGVSQSLLHCVPAHSCNLWQDSDPFWLLVRSSFFFLQCQRLNPGPYMPGRGSSTHCRQHSSYPPWWCLSEHTVQWHAAHSRCHSSVIAPYTGEPFHGPQLSWLNRMDSLYPFSQSNSILIHTRSTQPWRYGVTLCVEPAYFVSGVTSAFPLASFPQHSAIKVIYVEVWIRAFF